MFFRFLASLRPRETLFSATSIKVLLDHCLFLEQNSKGKKWCAKTRISALGYRVSRLAALLLMIICWYSGLSHREIFYPFSIPWPCKCLERSLLFWTEIPPRTCLSSNIINLFNRNCYRLKCVQGKPLFYTRSTRNSMVYHSGYLLIRNSISPSEPLHLHSRWSICLAWFLRRPSDPRRINTVDLLRHPDGT